MKIPLPNLDDRRWADLVEEGRSLIPLYAPEWTDHNIHDPGITLIELFAWVAEMDIYQLNRISDEHRRKFLSLIGVIPEPPRPAQTVLSFTFKNGPAPRLRASTQFAGKDPFGQETRFRTLEPIRLARGELRAIQVRDAAGFRDVTEHWRRDEPFGAFGPIPEPGSELYLGFSEAFQKRKPVKLYFKFAGPRSGEDERRRLIEEAQEQASSCRPPASDVDCQWKGKKRPAEEPGKQAPPYHCARTVWEIFATVRSEQRWLPLAPDRRQVTDDTRALTLDGVVRVRVQAPMEKQSIGKIAEELYYLRCRFEAGAYDAPPVIQTVAMNGVRAEQAVPVSASWTIRRGVVAPGPAPEPRRSTPLRLRFDDNGQINYLDFEKRNEDDPEFQILAYKPASPIATGNLTVAAAIAGVSNGRPHQTLALPAAPVQESSLELFTLEDDRWRAWSLRQDFDASKRNNSHFLLNPTTGEVTFGDGENGRVPRQGALIFAVYRSTRAEAGNLAARDVYYLADSPHNRAWVKNFDDVIKRFPMSFKVTESSLASLRAEGVPESILKKLERIKDQEIQGEADFLRSIEVILGEEQAARFGSSILKHTRYRCDVDHSDCIIVTNPVAATGGTPAETLDEAAGRAIRLTNAIRRAVTLKDYEELAIETPGAQLARATAWANLHPSFPCLKAPGLITVIILPDMPVARPMPSTCLRRAVARYLNRRRVIGTRVEVVGPTYLEVAVRATVKALSGVSKASLQQKIFEALNRFLDPLRGGPDGTGWPFGRDLYRSEIMQVIDEVAGVDHLVSLELIAAGCDPQCGNVCLGPTWLVAAGGHEIEVI